MRTSKLVAIGSVLASYAWVLAGGCSRSGAGDSNGTTGPGPGQMPDAAMDAAKIMSDAMGLGGSSGMPLHPLCGPAGVDEQCLPDDQQACANFRPPVIKPPLGSGGDGGRSADEGSGGAPEGGANTAGEGSAGAGQHAGGMAGEGGGPNGGGADSGTSGQGGGGDGSEPIGPARYGCQIGWVDDVASRSCQLAGEGGVNAPCFSGADCGAGLACVVDGQAGRCLRYCCGGDTACNPGSYCAEQQLRLPPQENDGSRPPAVPVCVPADDCSLEEPFPCPTGTECRCKGNTACLVVRDDGTTTCRTPGTGQQGEACPCAWNHVCSSVTNKCVKICNTDPSKNDCGEQRCQASSELPQNFGVCVGPVK